MEERKKALMNFVGHPDRAIAERAKAELNEIQKQEEGLNKNRIANRKETVKLRQNYAERGAIARQSKKEKERQLEIIDTGKIDDPWFVQLMEQMPWKLGQQLLSPETQMYKGSLVGNYRDLKNIFTGTTRVKEIELLEQKVADVYLTDEQKRAVIKSSLDSVEYDIIMADAAAEAEEKYPNLGILEFDRKVHELAEPRMEALAKKIVDKQKAIFEDAERIKQKPLSLDDPEGRQVIQQIMQEAKGNKEEARKIANQKGYKF